jgi:hypothetical protein
MLKFLKMRRICEEILDSKGERFQILENNFNNQNSIQEEIKIRLNSRDACHHSVKKVLSSSLLSKNIKIKIYRTIILSVILYGCEIWSLTLSEKRRLRVFENRVLRRTFRPKRDEVRGSEQNDTMRRRRVYIQHPIVFG